MEDDKKKKKEKKKEKEEKKKEKTTTRTTTRVRIVLRKAHRMSSRFLKIRKVKASFCFRA